MCSDDNAAGGSSHKQKRERTDQNDIDNDDNPYSRAIKAPSGKPAVLSITTRTVKDWYTVDTHEVEAINPFM
jgi:hypothetical protein